MMTSYELLCVEMSENHHLRINDFPFFPHLLYRFFDFCSVTSLKGVAACFQLEKL